MKWNYGSVVECEFMENDMVMKLWGFWFYSFMDIFGLMMLLDFNDDVIRFFSFFCSLLLQRDCNICVVKEKIRVFCGVSELIFCVCK